MTAEEILQIIADNFLCVRRLPFEVISHYSYREGDEERIKQPVMLEGGKTLNVTKEIITQNFDLEHFQKTKPPKWEKGTPEQRFEHYKKILPNGRKLVREVRTVEQGGWYYVTPVKNTSSSVTFSKKSDDCFFAPTLEEAIQLYLNNKNN